PARSACAALLLLAPAPGRPACATLVGRAPVPAPSAAARSAPFAAGGLAGEAGGPAQSAVAARLRAARHLPVVLRAVPLAARPPGLAALPARRPLAARPVAASASRSPFSPPCNA